MCWRLKLDLYGSLVWTDHEHLERTGNIRNDTPWAYDYLTVRLHRLIRSPL